MTTKSLTTFERRFGDWVHVHPPSDFFGKEGHTFLSRQVSRIVKSQLETADRIIVSQEDIADRIDKVAFGIERVSKGLESLKATFEWGFTEVIWQIEQTNELLQEILEVLQAPLDTQAKELKKRGEDAYRNGWFDDALKDFIESEKKNRYDFTIHQYLGNIYLFHRKNPKKALECYTKAVKYAAPKSPYYASFTLLHVGLTYYLQANFQKAYESTLKAIELTPNLYEAYYQQAQYCTNLDKYDEAIRHLKVAIEGDRYYCVKADSEKDFDVIKKQLVVLFKELRDKAHHQAKNEIDKAEELIRDAESYGVSDNSIVEAKEKLNKAKIFFKRKSYFDYLDASQGAKKAQKIVADSSITFLSNQISESKEKINKFKGKIPQWGTNATIPVVVLIFVLSFIPTFLVRRSGGGMVGTFLTFFLSIVLISNTHFFVVRQIAKHRYFPLIKEEEDRLNTLENNSAKAKTFI